MARANPLVIVVEDDELQREVASIVLEGCDVDVIPCETAEAATAILESLSRKPAMIFTDVRLPGALSGADLAFLAREKFPETRLLVTSGDKFPPVLPDGARFMPKPWTAKELVREAWALA